MDPRKAEKVTGYVMLTIGIVLIVIPAVLALVTFLNGAKVPQFVPTPTGDSDSFATAFATFSNVCLIFFMFITLVWAGSIVSSRGVTMIKDVKLKLVRRNLGEVSEAVKEEAGSKK